MLDKYLISGIGGGLDIVNAYLLSSSARNEQKEHDMAAFHPTSISNFKNSVPIPGAPSACYITAETEIHNVRRPYHSHFSSLIGSPFLYFSRKIDDTINIPVLHTSIQRVQEQNQYSSLFFVDGGGDSLILTPKDISPDGEQQGVFQGGDAEALEVLAGMPNAFLAVISAGLDINENCFFDNVELLYHKNAYFGRVNLQTGQKDQYLLDNLFQFQPGFLENYFSLAEQILVLTEDDLENPKKFVSHTATVTYHALKGSFGIQRTYVPWEPYIHGQKGVLVKPEHCWMYFFDAAKIHGIKQELNL